MRRVFTVEDVFQIKSIGVVIAGHTEESFYKIENGTEIIIKKPDGSEVKSKVCGREIINNVSAVEPKLNKRLGILVDVEDKHEIPINSVVFRE